ncbi:ras GTPase-activating protein 1-like isoform X1 [Haliotis asinina]|uniref:ras GTPase-activating protein 1-like isoform X1 n=1 Tax=Haliotis asinina TaxID=109174 RepID=UPI00353255FD
MADNNMSADGYIGTTGVSGDDSGTLDVGEDFDPTSADVECVEEQVDQLTAPDENFPCDYREWYHGRLDRQTAEVRLQEAGKEGSYLIRESDRKPGSFVLSYLGKANQLTHFRIIAMCGDYYIGGRQFESLSDLIGYYTQWSWLLKEEQLRYPVPPPEPVDDRRRVVAMLSYRKIPDTDELSFEKGDTFIVQNELENGWLWVTSVKNDESGIIPAALVEDLNGTDDPVDRCPYFHCNITKDEAVTKLGHAGAGSYLVRPSDNSPGALSLFFLSDMVRRFRIEKKGKKLFVGGRYFDSLDDIIERYRTEEIVEGYKLVNPVYRDNIDAFDGHLDKRLTLSERNTLYASIMRSGPSLLNNRDDRIEMTGYLYKRSEKTKKWKYFYTMLNGTEKHLFLFENERRSRPKDLIELQYSCLYPVHDSFFGRPYCFQLVSNYNNNHVQTCYLCAESGDVAQKWIHALKPYCNNTPVKRQRSLKELHSLSIIIYEAHKLHNKYLNHPYAVVSLNEVKVGRTEVGESTNPVWEQEIDLDDIPNDIETFSVTLYNKVKRAKETKVAEVQIRLSELDSLDQVDDWFTLRPASPNIKGEMGNIRLKAHYLHEIIMPLEEYTSLKELLLGDNYENIITLSKVCAKHEWLGLSKSLLRIFCHEKKEARLLRTLNDLEIDKEVEVSQLFRGTSLATAMMDQYMKMTATTFVQIAVKDLVQKIVESKQSCELNPAFLENPSDAKSNQEYFLSLLNSVIESIFKATEFCPTVLRYICGCLQRKAQQKWPDDETVKTRAVSGFIFLRLLCPAILTPKSFNLVSENPSETAARNLKLVAKAIQNLANLVESGTKESYMESVQPFIKKNKERVVQFLETLSNIPVDNTIPECPEGDPARDLATIHQLCAAHLEDLRAQSEAQPALKRFVVVTEKLTSKKEYMCGS